MLNSGQVNISNPTQYTVTNVTMEFFSQFIKVNEERGPMEKVRNTKVF